MIVDSGIREEAGVQRVVGVMVAQDDVGDVGWRQAEVAQRVGDIGLAVRHPWIHHRHHVAGADKGAGADHPRRGERASQEDVEPGVTRGGCIGHHAAQATPRGMDSWPT